MAKRRTEVPDVVGARLLFESDHTCCVCREKGLPVQVHHLNEDPASHEPENLAVLCFHCYDRTQIRGGFGRKLGAAEVSKYREDWIERVARRRDKADELAATRQARCLRVLASTLSESIELRIPAKQALLAYLDAAPAVLMEAYSRARPRWNTGVTAESLRAVYSVIDVVESIWVHLASWLPEGHFGGKPAKEYISEFLSSRFEWHRSLTLSGGASEVGTIEGPITATSVLDDAEEAVAGFAASLLRDEDEFSFDAWRLRWDAARDLGGERSDARSGDDAPRSRGVTVVDLLGQAGWGVRAVRFGGAEFPEGHFGLIYERPDGESELVATLEGHSPEIFFVDFDGDGVSEVAVRWACGAHSRGFRLYRREGETISVVPGSEIGSDWPSIWWEDRDGDGKFEIYSKNVNWNDRDADPPVSVYVLRAGRYEEA